MVAVVVVHCHIAIRSMDIVNNKMKIYDFKWPISCGRAQKTIDIVVDCAESGRQRRVDRKELKDVNETVQHIGN